MPKHSAATSTIIGPVGRPNRSAAMVPPMVATNATLAESTSICVRVRASERANAKEDLP